MRQIHNSRMAPVPSVRRPSGKAAETRHSAHAASARARKTAHISPSSSKQAASSPTASRRRAPRQRRALATLDAVVTAAEQLLVEVGYARSSTNAVARRAGVSVGSVYQYFADKESIFRAVLRRHQQQMKPLILDTLTQMADSKQDLIELTLELLRKMARANGSNPRLMAAIERELAWLEREQDLELDLQRIVSDLVSKRYRLPPQELAVIAPLIVMTVSLLSRWLVHGKPAELHTERFVAATGRMLRGLLATDGVLEP